MTRSIALLLLVLVFTYQPVQSADLDQARREGEVVLYTTMVVSDFQIFHKALVKKYSFLKVNHVRLGTAALAARAVAEHRAGRHLADVFGPEPGFNELSKGSRNIGCVYEPRGEVYP